MNRNDIYRMVTKEMVELMEQGTKPWHLPFRPGLTSMPSIRVTGEQYRGGNLLTLWIMQQLNQYSSNQWMTMKQANQLGGKVKKGEKSTPICFFKKYENEDDTEYFAVRYYRVFNVDQIEGLPEEYHPQNLDQITEEERIDECQKTFDRLPATIEEGDKAAFSPRRDIIIMPPFTRFRSAESYYATLAHEYIHWTGHSSRLQRLPDPPYKTEEYAFEELVAELGAAFLTSMMQIATEEREGHAAYLGHWITQLKKDPAYLFKAASSAQKAVDYLFQHEEEAVIPLRMEA